MQKGSPPYHFSLLPFYYEAVSSELKHTLQEGGEETPDGKQITCME